jgi:hypothetical protein
MSTGPQKSAPPGRAGRVTPSGRQVQRRRRPVQSPDADTVLLAAVTISPEEIPDLQPARPDQHDDEYGRGGFIGTKELFLPWLRREADPGGAGGARPEAGGRRIWVSRLVLALILGMQALLTLRMHNTAFEDEAMYLYVGHQEIASLLHGAALQGNYASYLPGSPLVYPVLGAAADGLGGLAAARALSLVEMLATTILLYALTRRMFNERVGLCAAVLFSVAEGTILLGNLATSDATSLFLLALAAWLVVRAAPSASRLYLLAAPAAALAVAASYWALLYVPAVALLAGLAAYPYHGRRAASRPLLLAATTLELLAIGVIAAGKIYMIAIVTAISTRSPGSSQALPILENAARWAGPVAGLALLGAVAYAIRDRTEPSEVIAPSGGQRHRIAVGVVLAGPAILTIAYTLYLNSDVSADRNVAFGLFLAAPMAGVGLARIVGDHFRRAQVGIAIWGAAMVLGMTQASILFGSWTNSAGLVSAIQHDLRPGAHYLVENDDVPIYYLRGHSDAQAGQFTSTYYISFAESGGKVLTGTPGFLAAVRAGYFRVIAYDDTVTPALDQALATALAADPDYRRVAAFTEKAPDFTTTCYVWVRTY